MVSLLILVLCIIGLLRHWLVFSKHKEPAEKPSNEVEVDAIDSADTLAQDEPFVKTPYLVILLLATSVLYCLAFQLRIANFVVLTTLFLWVSIFILSDHSGKHFFRSLVVALVCSVVFYFVFTRIFVVDLPGFQ